jgi:hypothetical protein
MTNIGENKILEKITKLASVILIFLIIELLCGASCMFKIGLTDRERDLIKDVVKVKGDMCIGASPSINLSEIAEIGGNLYTYDNFKPDDFKHIQVAGKILPEAERVFFEAFAEMEKEGYFERLKKATEHK